ncbi:UNVERIFIED_CONTAM: hypothetical protein FKN15_060666 [Acipenser sinensis]
MGEHRMETRAVQIATVGFIFVYLKGTGLSGDIAIDDIELHFESCSLPPPTTDVPTVPSTYDPTANDCDFEEDPCSWQQDPHNDFDWLRQQGSAGSGSIGPAGDHTTGRTRELISLVLFSIFVANCSRTRWQCLRTQRDSSTGISSIHVQL